MRYGMLTFVLAATVLFGSSCELIDHPPADERDAPFIGTVWHLDAFESGREETRVRDGRTFTIRFLTDGNAGIVADCNTCGATYERGRGNTLSITPPLCTRMYCGDESFDIRFVTALQEAESYEIEGRTLRLFYDDGRKALRLRAQ